ncbi:glycoside hydrolase family 13 protein [Microbulbifer sp. SAOS-129_SWC]|uniref:glycoside hydrolase family 13 protein n=1 Tax=Microbulbifer sp. SAOS-129_SWC TaxID=3145235 RepID=UPI003217C681
MTRFSALILALCCAAPVMAETATAPGAVDRVEPPNWWTGMAVPDLQLMVHGKDIAELKASLDYPGVTLAGTEREQNPNYLFLDLQVSPESEPGTVEITLRDGDTTRAVIHYELKARRPGSAQRRGFDSSDAIYLLTPDRFANGNPGNDSTPDTREGADRATPGGRHGGDLAGMRAHLNYIKGMGFTQIWPTPLVENDQPAYSYHGYAATDLYRIDPRFGSNADYFAFVQAARKNGIGVIQDMVLNHLGSEHWWLRDLPSGDWLNGDGIDKGQFQITTHMRTTLADPYAADVDREAFSSGWFVDSMPDMNQRDPRLANYLIQNSLWWVESADLSGIRADTYGYSDPQFLQHWSARIHREYPNFSVVGEEWSRNPVVVSHWQIDKQNPDGYKSYLQSLMDFPLFYALRESLVEEDTLHSGFTDLYEAMVNDILYPHPQRMVILGGNHDTSRLFSALDDDYGLYKMAVTYLATMRGIPQFFYGDELLMQSPKERNDGIVRSDFPGGWAGDRADGFTGKGLKPEQQRAQNYVRALFNWRHHTPAVQSGKLKHFAPLDGPYVYFRYDDQNKIMVALNKSDQPRNLDMARYAEVLHGETRATDVISGKRYKLDQLVVPARDVLVVDLK